MTDSLSLMDIVQEHLASERLHLPVFPPLVLQLQDMLARDEVSMQQVAAKIMEDQALASQLLRVANSAFFSGLSKVLTVKDAIIRLGAKQVINILALVTQQQHHRSSHKIITVYMEGLWKHAVSCAMGAKWLAEKSGYKTLAQEAFLGGLMHDIGKLFLLKVLEDIQTSGKYQITLSTAIITEVMESLHAEQGCRLLQQWNLPEMYCAVARDHHKADYDVNNAVLLIVRLVNLACHRLGIGLQHDPSLLLAVTPEAQALEVSELLLAELEIMLEDAMTLAR